VKRVNVMEIAMDVVPKRNADRKVVDQVHNTARKEVADRKVVDPVPNADQKEVTDRKVVDRRTSGDLKKVEALSLEDPVGVALEDVSLG